MAGTFVYITFQPPTYRAVATLIIGRAIDDPNPTSNQFWLSQQLAQTYADIARRALVRQATMEALGLDWLPNYTARALPNSHIIEIAVVDSSPERAQAVANELARQLILQSPTAPDQEDQERLAFVNQQLADMERQIDRLEAEIENKQSELAGLTSAAQIRRTETDLAALQNQLTSLQQNYATLLANTQQGALNILRVLEPAPLPRSPVSENDWLTLLISAGATLILAAGAVYLLDYLDDAIQSEKELAQTVDLPILGTIADIEKGEDSLVTLHAPRGPLSEAFRALRTSIHFALVEQSRYQLLVASANPMEGKSAIAANLAIVNAQAGYNVLLIDADLRRPRQHRLFAMANEPGLSNLLLTYDNPQSGQSNSSLLSAAIQPTDVEGLSLLPSGAIPPSPAELLAAAKTKTLLRPLPASLAARNGKENRAALSPKTPSNGPSLARKAVTETAAAKERPVALPIGRQQKANDQTVAAVMRGHSSMNAHTERPEPKKTEPKEASANPAVAENIAAESAATAAEVKHLRRQLEGSRLEIARLQEQQEQEQARQRAKIHMLNQTILTLQESLAQTEARERALQTEAAEYRERLEATKENLAQFRETISNQIKMLTSLNQALAEEQAQTKENEDKIERLTQMLHKSRQQAEETKQQLLAYRKGAASEQESLQAELKRRRLQIEALEREIELYKNHSQLQNQLVSELQNSLIKRGEELKRSYTAFAQQNREFTRFQQATNQRIHALEEELARARQVKNLSLWLERRRQQQKQEDS